MTKACLNVCVEGKDVGKLSLTLLKDDAPDLCKQFESLVESGVSVRFVKKGEAAQFGDDSADTDSLIEENFQRSEEANTGMLSAIPSNDRITQFFLCFRAAPRPEAKHVVFAKLDDDDDDDDEDTRTTLNTIENISTDPQHRPAVPVTLTKLNITTPATKKDDPLQQRLLNLKMRINQAKRQNHKELLQEGQREATDEAKTTYKKQIQKQDKAQRERQWMQCHKNNDSKHMLQQASDSLRKHQQKQAKAEANRHDIDDHYNPEGQHRNYQRNLKTIPKGGTTNTANESTSLLSSQTFDPLACQETNAGTTASSSEDGAKRLARELKRRVEKSKTSKRKGLEFEGTDVSYVNQRNKRFNEKISRNYDKYTAEIRQNLERGTAL